MHVMGMGFNHQTAPLAVRERLTGGPADVAARLSAFAAQPGRLRELVILATCGRVECYAAADEINAGVLADARAWLLAGQDVAGCEPYIYVDADAALHLGRVAAGLES